MELTMSMFANKADYWKARAEMAERTVEQVADIFGIGADARAHSVILENVRNAVRRSACLSLIEAHHTIPVEDDDGEPMEEQLAGGDGRLTITDYGRRHMAPSGAAE